MIFGIILFHGGLQAFAGLAEASAGGLATLGSGGLAAPMGWPVLAHGLDQFITGMSTAITGKHRATLTEQLLQKTAMSPEWASFTNDTLTIGGTMGGTAIVRASRLLEAFRRANIKVPYRMATEKEIANEVWKFSSKDGGNYIKIRGK